MTPKRNLFLHLSALSDREYGVYVQALQDIFDDGDEVIDMSDDFLENRRVSLPVVRAWMKGRFRDLGSAEIDKVLQLFSSQIAQKEMSGGQLLAALRLLMHVRIGRDVNEGNVFVQADPSSPTTSRFATPSSNARPSFEAERPTSDSPPSPPKSSSLQTNPFFSGAFLQPTTAIVIPPSQLASDAPRRASLSSAPAPPPLSSKPRVDGMGVSPGSTNPFLQRAKTHSGAYASNFADAGRTPPLPPRKPSHMSSSTLTPRPPPVPAKVPHAVTVRHNTSSNSGSSSSSTPQTVLPLPPHRVTPLMQQSLLASRVGASLKKAEEEAHRIRVLEVIRSSSDVSVPLSHTRARDRTQSSSRSPDKGIRRPVPLPPRTIAVSAPKSDSGAPSECSLAEVASARLGSHSRPRTRTNSPDRMSRVSSSSETEDKEERGTPRSRQFSASEQFSPPPTHPARRPSARSSSGRSRHIRSPSYQFNNAHGTPATSASFAKASSASGVHGRGSRSPSPSQSPTSPVNARPTRSHSMHQPSSPTLAGRLANSGVKSVENSPLPPPRRKRPESVQFPTRPRGLEHDGNVAADVDPASPFSNSFGVEQRSSTDSSSGVVSSMAALFDQSMHLGNDKDRGKERDKERDQHAFASLQRTFNALQQRAQPTITRARFKAEAGLAPRRGFVPNGRDYHMAGEDADRLVSTNNSGDEAGMDFSPVTDRDEEDVSGDDTIRARGRGRMKNYSFERDELKLPEGEGWTRL